MLAHTTYELLWLESLLGELHIPYSVPMLFCDNLSAIMLSHNMVLHVQTKHIELDIHFVRERVVVKKLHIQHVMCHAQLANMLTKPLMTILFLEFHPKLKVMPKPPP